MAATRLIIVSQHQLVGTTSRRRIVQLFEGRTKEKHQPRVFVKRTSKRTRVFFLVFEVSSVAHRQSVDARMAGGRSHTGAAASCSFPTPWMCDVCHARELLRPNSSSSSDFTAAQEPCVFPTALGLNTIAPPNLPLPLPAGEALRRASCRGEAVDHLRQPLRLHQEVGRDVPQSQDPRALGELGRGPCRHAAKGGETDSFDFSCLSARPARLPRTTCPP